MFDIYASLKEIRQTMVLTGRTIRGIPFQYPLKQINKHFACRTFCSWLNFVRVIFPMKRTFNVCTATEMFDIYANLKVVRQKMVLTGRTVKGVTFRYTLKQISKHFGYRTFCSWLNFVRVTFPMKRTFNECTATEMFDIYASLKERGQAKSSHSKSSSIMKYPKEQTFYPSCKPYAEPIKLPMKLYIYVPP